MVLCPWCDKDIQIDVGGHENWDDPEFQMSCPKCGKQISISVEVCEYQYEATKVEDEKEIDKTETIR